MKITLDETVCLKHKITLEETILALAVKLCKGDALSKLAEKKVLINQDNNFAITPFWSDKLDEIIVESSGGVDEEQRLVNLAKKMRECFPEGRMPGTPYYYRCNNREIVLKLKKFFLQYGKHSDEELIDACKRFVASFNGNYKYLPLLKYFIFKFKDEMDEQGLRHRVEHSPLADYLENKEEDIDYNSSDDWLVTSRN